MGYFLGIDLGTTYTAAAVTVDGVRAEMLALDHASAIAPSVVAIAAGQEPVLGVPAQRRARTNPGGVAREFKRRFGDTTPIILDGRPYGAEQLMVRLTKWIVERATIEQGEPPEAVAICHPANWGPYKRELLNDVASLAELPNVVFVTEPTAAAWWYASQGRIAIGDTVGVYDLGGGTFDAVVLRRNPEGFELVGQPAGIERLGGIDLDEAVLHFALDAAGVDLDALDRTDPVIVRQVAELRDDCRMAKEALSSDTTTDIIVNVGPVSHQVRLTRTEFEDLARPSIQSTISAFNQAVEQAGVDVGDLTAVLLVGGSSRVPLVAEMVGYTTGRPVTADIQSKQSVALGAALYAHHSRFGNAADSNSDPGPASLVAGESAPVQPGTDGVGVSAETEPGEGTASAESPPKQARPEPLAVSTSAGPNRRTLLLAGAVVVAVALIGVVLALGGRSPTEETTAPTTTSGPPVQSQPPQPDLSESTTPTTVSATPGTAPTTATPADSDPVELAPPGRSDGWVTGPSADPLRSRNWASAGPTSAPTELWRIDDPIGGAPVVADGVMYAAFGDDTLRAIDFATGTEVWLRETSFGNATPVVTGDAVFYVDGFDVVAVDRATGSNELLRIVPPSSLEIQASPDAPTVVGGVAYLVYQSFDVDIWTSNLFAVDLDTGLVKWQWSTQSGRAMLPLMVTDDAVVVVTELLLSAFEIETGAERWTAMLEGDISPNMALIADGALIVRDSRLRAFELTDGSQRWSVSDSSLQYASAGGLVFTQSLDVRAIDTTTGAVTWSTRWTDGRLLSDAMSVGDGVVYVHGSSTGTIGAYDTVTGAELWVIDHEPGLEPGIPLVVHGGVLVAVEGDRQLVAFG